MPPFRFRNGASLVDPGDHSTIGMLMGNLFGASMSTVGWRARAIGISQLAIQGWISGSMIIASDMLRDIAHPRLMLY